MRRQPHGLRTWIDINTRALAHNVRAFRRRLAPGVRLMAVAKSNAYGHGLLDYSRAVERLGADWIGVDSIVEGLALRCAGVHLPILVLGATLPERLRDAAAAHISITASHAEFLQHLRRFRGNRPLRIHVKLDTGMHRQGFQLHEIAALLRGLRALPPSVTVEGAYTHFASAKNPAFPADTLAQLEQFTAATDAIAAAGFRVLRHVAATSGALLFPQTHGDLVRIGIGLYGLWPSDEVRAACADGLDLQPILSWRTVVSEVKTIPPGSAIGYNGTEVVAGRTRIAICPIGYWHGYPRALSSIGHVGIRGVRCRVLGRVSMDMIVVDASRVPTVRVGDIVTLIGRDRRAEVTTDELAQLTGTINYEIVTRLNPLMERVYR